MHIVEGISIEISAIRSNKLRSLLTTLGIIIGVAAVLAMIAIGDGAKTLVLDEVERFGGANMFKLYIAKVVPEWPAVISLEWILISVSFSAIIGISFGLYPAIKASTLPPIEALRKS